MKCVYSEMRISFCIVCEIYNCVCVCVRVCKVDVVAVYRLVVYECFLTSYVLVAVAFFLS